jgi:hypothetical protein
MASAGGGGSERLPLKVNGARGPAGAGGLPDGMSSPPSLLFTPKYRERNIYRKELDNKAGTGPQRNTVTRDEMVTRHIQGLGFSNVFLKLHFMMLYTVQILAQLGIVVWSVILYGLRKGAASNPVWLAVVATVDVAITLLLVIDLVAHLTDNAAVYWKDW